MGKEYEDYLAEQKIKSDERHNAIVDKMQKVAKAMGEGWTMKRVNYADGQIMEQRVKLVHRDYDYYIFVNGIQSHRKSEKDKIRIRADGDFFNGKATHKEGKPIYVSFDKKPEVIARDIERRVLPELIEYDKNAKQNYKEAQEYDAAVNTNMWSLVQASKGLLKHSSGLYHRNFLNYYSRDGIRIEAKCSATYVDLKIEDLSPGQANEIIKYIFDNFVVESRKK